MCHVCHGHADEGEVVCRECEDLLNMLCPKEG